MPHRGLPICYHTEEIHKRVLPNYPEGVRVEQSRCPDQFWLIRQIDRRWDPPKRLIECKYCGKQRWTSTQWLVQTLEPKPKDSK
ncbi:hypothetical protein LCGC14_1643360 [marine sediment metagenome]|uniref:Uncharacterized protein n=1 Tax=marine sediment metagenome TaxID=412755 RepID=A0A0F9ILI5_9ZZZZ